MTAENSTPPSNNIDPIIAKTLDFFNQEIPVIEDRLALEREIKKRYKVDKPQDTLNLVLSTLAEYRDRNS